MNNTSRLTPTGRLILLPLQLSAHQSRTEPASSTRSSATQLAVSLRTLEPRGLIIGTDDSETSTYFRSAVQK